MRPSGKFCKGYAFDLPNVQLRAQSGGNLRLAARPARWCIWDGRISNPQENGEKCLHCDRTVQDTHLGTITENLVHAHAVQVFIPNVNQWALLEMVELPPITGE